MPWVLGALGVAAVVQLGFTLAPDSYSILGPYLLVDFEMVFGAARAVSPFLLAAAVLVGAERWRPGRHWLIWGAVLLGLHGLLELAFSAWWVVRSPDEDMVRLQTVLFVRVAASTAAEMVAYGALAAGLWVARSRRSLTIPRKEAIAAVGLIGATAFATAVWLAAQFVAPAGASEAPYVAFAVLAAVAYLTTALVGVAAIRALPADGWLHPETLIAAGATLAVAGGAAQSGFGSSVLLNGMAFDDVQVVFTLIGAAIVIGLACMVAGFAAGALAREHALSAATPGSAERR